MEQGAAMTSLAFPKGNAPITEADLGMDRYYVSVIHGLMTSNSLGYRKLALLTGISKSRLSNLLHRNPDKRASMTLNELEKILAALDINILQAIIRAETFQGDTFIDETRYTSVITMLSEMFKGLPLLLVTALEELDGIDGTEVRKEWAGPLQAAVVNRLVKEVSSVMARRASFAEIGSQVI